MPVVGATPMAGETLAGKGLVGKIIEVTAHSAKVQLITDSESSVAAKIQGSRAEGIVEGSVSGKLTWTTSTATSAVDPKLVVVTSGYGGVYPADIPIGIVANVGEEDVNIYKEIEVQPFVDFRVLEEVMVLIVPERATTSPAGHHDDHLGDHDHVAGTTTTTTTSSRPRPPRPRRGSALMGRRELIIAGQGRPVAVVRRALAGAARVARQRPGGHRRPVPDPHGHRGRQPGVAGGRRLRLLRRSRRRHRLLLSPSGCGRSSTCSPATSWACSWRGSAR